MENLLLVTVDSLRPDHLGCYGYGRETAPTVDDLAATSHRFTNAFANAQATRASFPAILTSTYPHMYGGYKQLSDERTVVAEPLAAAGYRTGGFHSNPFLSTQFGYGAGFDTFYDSQSEPTVTSQAREWVKQNLDEDGLVFRTLKSLFDTTEKHAGIEVGSSYVRADDLTDRAISFVRDGDETGNFLWIHYMDVHHPYVPPERHQLAFRDEPLSDRESVQLRRKMLEDPDGVTDHELETIIDLYDAEIRFTDTELARLLDAVDEAWGETATFFTADHGEEFREHGRFSHSTLHDEGIHVPLVVDLPNGSHGVHEHLVALLDLAPTILDYAGATIPESYQGTSFRSVMDDQGWDRDHVISEAGYQDDGRPRIAYRTRRWKFISDRGEDRLFDLQADPGETTDVIESYPDVLESIHETLAMHQSRVAETDQAVDHVAVTGEIEDRLEALGYME